MFVSAFVVLLFLEFEAVDLIAGGGEMAADIVLDQLLGQRDVVVDGDHFGILRLDGRGTRAARWL